VIRAVGFDLDDTLLDHRSAASAGLAALVKQQDWVYEGVIELGKEWERVERLHFANYIAGALTMREQRRERMRDFLALAEVEVRDTELDELFEEYLSHYAKSWVPFPDVRRTLENLSHLGFRLAVLTNGQQEQQESKLASMGFLEMFESVLAIGTLTAPKPDARAFLELSSALGCLPDEVLYVGDDPHCDAIAATKAGLHGVWLNRAGQDGPDGIGIQVRTLDFLVPAIHEWNGMIAPQGQSL